MANSEYRNNRSFGFENAGATGILREVNIELTGFTKLTRLRNTKTHPVNLVNPVSNYWIGPHTKLNAQLPTHHNHSYRLRSDVRVQSANRSRPTISRAL